MRGNHLPGCLRAFHRRMIAEAILRAAAWGVAAGTLASLLESAAAHLFALNGSGGRTWGAGLCAFAVFALAAYVRERPSAAQTAARLDALGLRERVSTMYARRESDGVMDTLQRRDAVRQLEAVAPRQLRLRWPWRAVGVCVCALALLAGVSRLPYGLLLSDDAQERAAQSEERRRIDEMLLSMRERIENAQISDEEKEALMAQLETLGELLARSETELTALAQMERASKDMDATLAALQSAGSFLGELMRFDLLRELGMAIRNQEVDPIHAAFGDLAGRLTGASGEAQKARLQEVITAIQTAQENMSAEAGDAYLAPSFREMAHGLSRVVLTDFDEETANEEIHGTLEETERVVCQAIAGVNEKGEPQNAGEDEQTAGGTTASAADASGGGQSEEGGGAAGLNDALYQGGSEGVRIGGAGVKQSSMTELIYEPSLDTRKAKSAEVPDAADVCVPYGDVYGMYYAQMLKQTAELPAELQSAVTDYFGGI